MGPAAGSLPHAPQQVTRAADAALRVLLAPAGAETGSAMHMQKDAGLYQTDGVLCWK